MKKFFPTQVIYNWYRNTLRHPKYRWFVILGTLLYILNPADISPDVLPVLGWIDDGMIATLFVAEMSQIALSQLKSRKDWKLANQSASEAAETVDVDAVSVS
jgi:uncharacterized membrane protein YkvA (DUF1232 family)